jgi:hypothetical protein
MSIGSLGNLKVIAVAVEKKEETRNKQTQSR